MRVLRTMAPWSMVPVLTLGILVAIVKLADFAVLGIGPGLWAFAALTVLVTILSRLSAQRLWRYAEDAGLVPVSGGDRFRSEERRVGTGCVRQCSAWWST